MDLRACRTCVGIGVDHHAVGHRQRAGHLQLRHLFHFHQAHAAGGLQRVAFVIAERRNLDAGVLGRIDHQRAGGRFERLSVDCEFTRSAIEILSAGSRRHAGDQLRRRARTGTACHSDALRTHRGTFRRSKWWAAPPHRPAGRRCGPACFSKDRRSERCRSRWPMPSWKRVRSLRSQVVPSRHGMHQPQLSCA